MYILIQFPQLSMTRFLPYSQEWTEEDDANMQDLFGSAAYKSLHKQISNHMAERNALLVNELAEGKEDRHSLAIMALDNVLRWLENYEFNEEEVEEPRRETRLEDTLP